MLKHRQARIVCFRRSPVPCPNKAFSEGWGCRFDTYPISDSYRRRRLILRLGRDRRSCGGRGRRQSAPSSPCPVCRRRRGIIHRRGCSRPPRRCNIRCPIHVFFLYSGIHTASGSRGRLERRRFPTVRPSIPFFLSFAGCSLR